MHQERGLTSGQLQLDISDKRLQPMGTRKITLALLGERKSVPPLEERDSQKLRQVGGLLGTSQDRRNRCSPAARLAHWTAIFNRDGFPLPRSRLRGTRRVIKQRVFDTRH